MSCDQVDATEEEPRSFIYMSADAMSNPAKLLVLIQGDGVVRAGQWARRLIINQDLDSGTQIPFITRAKEVGAPHRPGATQPGLEGCEGGRVVGVTMGLPWDDSAGSVYVWSPGWLGLC